MLPIWGPGCALVTGVSLRKGLDAGRGRGCCSRGVFASTLAGTPPSLWALYLLPLPHSENSVHWGWGGAHGLGWLPWPPWKRSLGYASLILAPGAGGTKATAVVLCH